MICLLVTLLVLAYPFVGAYVTGRLKGQGAFDDCFDGSFLAFMTFLFWPLMLTYIAAVRSCQR